jgi:hypothetical protein
MMVKVKTKDQLRAFLNSCSTVDIDANNLQGMGKRGEGCRHRNIGDSIILRAPVRNKNPPLIFLAVDPLFTFPCI